MNAAAPIRSGDTAHWSLLDRSDELPFPIPADRPAPMSADDTGGILFIENREKTHLWEAAAVELRRRGVRVDWIVQNHLFAPSPAAGAIHQLPYSRDRVAVDPADYPVLVTDRGRDHFAAGSAHYPHYAAAIDDIVAAVRPALVVGETTLFQELLALDSARRHRALYVQADADRYPHDRFSILVEDSQNRLADTGFRWDPAERRAVAEAVAAGRSTLPYMRPASLRARSWRRIRWAATRGRVFAARLLGERFNTPSLRLKAELTRVTAARVARWEKAASPVPEGRRAVLYPLQMQPEANIDVWGRPYFNQVALIERLAAAAPDDVLIAVKGNPKAKYELSEQMLALAERRDRIVLLPMATRMDEAQAQVIGSISVCGTVGVEAVFGRWRCVSLRQPVIKKLLPHMTAETPEEAVEKLLTDPQAGVGSVENGETFLDYTGRTSFPGIISDSFTDPACLAPDNVSKVADGIEAAWRIARTLTGGERP